MKRPKQHTDPSVQSPEIITPLKVRQRKLAQAVLAGNKTGADIGRELMPHVENPAQAVHNRLSDKGVQEAIREEAKRMDFTEDDIREVVARRITRLKSSDDELRPGDAKVVEIGARIKAMLTDKQIVENVTSADTLIERAEEALSKLKHDTQAEDQITSVTLSANVSQSESALSVDHTKHNTQSTGGQSNVEHGSEHGQGENAPTPSGNGVEATGRTGGEKRLIPTQWRRT